MKCIQCGVDNNLRYRTANRGHCKSCGHPFAFEPKTMSNPPQCTDPFFAKLIQDLAVNNTLFFTQKQLYYLLNRRLEQKAMRQMNGLQSGGVILMFFGVFTLLAGVGLLLTPIGAALWFWGWRKKRQARQQQPKTFRVNQPTVFQWLQRWRQAHGELEKLLSSIRSETSAIAVSPEISDYSFDRVIVCEDDSVAHLLITNNLHFEHNCAVLSLNGILSGFLRR